MRKLSAIALLLFSVSAMGQFTGQIDFDLEGLSPNTEQLEVSHWSMHVGENNLVMEVHNIDENGDNLVFVPNSNNGDLYLYSTAEKTEIYFTSKAGQRSATSSLVGRGFRMTKTGNTQSIGGVSCDVWDVVNEDLEGQFCIAASIEVDVTPYLDMYVDNVFMRSMQTNGIQGFPLYWEVFDRYDGSVYRKGVVTSITQEVNSKKLSLPGHLKPIESIME